MSTPLKLMMSETVAGAASEETIELLLGNLRDQLLTRLKRGGYIVNPADVRGIVRGQYGGSSRVVEVWAMYEQHTAEHREALCDAYADGLASFRVYRATVRDEHVPTGEDGQPLAGSYWAEYVKVLAACPFDPERVEPGPERLLVEVYEAAWRRGWDEIATAEAEGRAVHGAPYRRMVRP